MSNSSKAYDAVIRARTALLVDQPFFGCLALQLKLEEIKEGHWLYGSCKTMAVDGYRMYYYAPFVLEIDEQELMGVVAHEVFHCVFKHMSRRGHRNGKIWNCAGDFVINADLKKANFKLPGPPLGLAEMFGNQGGEPKKGHLLEPKFDGMGTEEVYERLMQQLAKQPKLQIIILGGGQGDGKGKGGQQPGKGKGQGKGQDPGDGLGIDPAGCGGVIDAGSGPKQQDGDGEGGATPSPEQVEHDWDANVRMAIAVAKSHNAGNVPGYLERLVTELSKPKVNWKDLTRNFIDVSMVKEFSWARPNRRSAAIGALLPGMISDSMHKLVMLIDVSGSIGNDLQRAMVSEGAGALDDGVADQLVIAYFDTEIKHVDEFVRGDLVTCRTMGGGGTDFAPPFQWIIDNQDDASCVIMLTDMCPLHWNLPEPDVPVLFGAFCPESVLAHVQSQVKFGEIVHVDSAW